MFACSIAFYLSVKKLQMLGVDKRIITVANYVFPTIVFIILAVINKLPLIYPIVLLVMFVIFCAILNWVAVYYAVRDVA